MKLDYKDGDVDGVEFSYGYKRFSSEDAKAPYFYIDCADSGECITLELTPSQLRKLAMRLIKLSYRGDATK